MMMFLMMCDVMLMFTQAPRTCVLEIPRSDGYFNI